MNAPTEPPFRLGVLPVTPLQQNCSILVCARTGRAAIVDPGGDVEDIVRGIGEMKAQPEAIWLTHGHFDHVGGAAELAERYGIPVVGPHHGDDWLLAEVEEQGRLFGVPGGRNVTPDRWLEEGDSVSFGEVTFAVRHCPGHTPGHVLFVHEEARLGLFGDVLFKGAIGRTDFPRSDHEALLRGIREKILTLPDDLAFVPGHGPMSTVGEERRSNPFLQGL